MLDSLDNLSAGDTLSDWIPLDNGFEGRLRVQMNESAEPDACKVLGENKADHRILNVAIRMRNEYPEKLVTLVTKDINLRIKAKSMEVQSDDFTSGMIKNVSSLYTGRSEIENVDSAVIDKIYNDGGCNYKEVLSEKPFPNHYFILKNGKASALAFYNDETEMLERIEKKSAYGIKPRNAEQIFALHALLDDNIKLVTLSGVAGTGKTLLALSSAIEQKTNYRQIYLGRPIVPLSNKDIGYLPGDIKSKLNPYMEPLWDNLKTIQSQFKETEKDYKRISEMVEQEKLMISPLAYIRGRSLSNIIFIVDEAQNLTPHEVKTIITRAGENTKIIFTGDIFQIDSPYLDTQSNGLSYLIDRIHTHRIHAHVTLEKGERSEVSKCRERFIIIL